MDLELEIRQLETKLENYKKAVQLLKDQRNKYIAMYAIVSHNGSHLDYQRETIRYEDLHLDTELNKVTKPIPQGINIDATVEIKTVKDLDETSLEFRAIKELCDTHEIPDKYYEAFFQIYKGIPANKVNYGNDKHTPCRYSVHLEKKKFLKTSKHQDLVRFLSKYVHDYRLKKKNLTKS